MKKTVKIKFRKSNDYKIIPVTGVWGGLSPNNEVVFDLFIERHLNPEFIEIEIDEGGKKVGERQEGEQAFIRESQIGIVLRPDIAYSIGEWLMGKAHDAGFVKS